jgi:branched-chain amino acid aminotransferase
MSAVTYRDGEFLPIEDLDVGIRTHALHYGTGVFEGIRAYWDPSHDDLLVFRPREHFVRLLDSARVYSMKITQSVDELCAATAELLARNNAREDMYVRPLLFKSSQVTGLWSDGLQHTLIIYVTPMGDYVGRDGIRCSVSSWRRPDGASAPARAKIAGMYAGMALARHEALARGFDEAITLTSHGKVAEGSAENIFLVLDGQLVTPSTSEDILAGITRATIIELARGQGLQVVERPVNRSELLVAEEVFLCGTAAEVSPVVEIDHRPVGSGAVGPVTRSLARLYDDTVHGRTDRAELWCRPVYASPTGGAGAAGEHLVAEAGGR